MFILETLKLSKNFLTHFLTEIFLDYLQYKYEGKRTFFKSQIQYPVREGYLEGDNGNTYGANRNGNDSV